MTTVDSWFGTFDHPLKAEMLAIREIIMGADARMIEMIKWQTPTFSFKGNLASFNPRAKKHVSLLFHTGALIPGDHPHLQGGNKTARYMQFADMADVDAQRSELQAIVAAWCAMKTGPIEDNATMQQPATAPTKRVATVQSTAKITQPKKVAAAKPTAKKATAKKATAKKATAKKATAKKATAKKATAKKATAKQATAKKAGSTP